MAHEVFISYAKEDLQTVEIVCQALEAEGIQCWYAPRDVFPGAVFEDAVVMAISASHLMLLILSSHALGSKYVRRECAYAADEEVPIFPFRIEDVRPGGGLKFYLGSVQWLDALTAPLESHLARLANSVRISLQEEAERKRTLEEAARKRAEAEEAQRKREAEESARRAEEERHRREEEERQRQETETGRLEEEAARQRALAEVARVQAEEEARQRAAAERGQKEESLRKREEEERRAGEEAEAARAAAEQRGLEDEQEREEAAEIAARQKKERPEDPARHESGTGNRIKRAVGGALAIAAAAIIIILGLSWIMNVKNPSSGEEPRPSVQGETAPANNVSSEPVPTATTLPSVQQKLVPVNNANSQPGPSTSPSVAQSTNVNDEGKSPQTKGNSADTDRPSTTFGRPKNITPLQVSDSRVIIRSDEPLNDYSAYRSGDHYYVVIPKANVPSTQSMRGRGYDDIRVQKRGSDAVISFKLQPGTSAHINQKFNMLEVVFDSPPSKKQN